MRIKHGSTTEEISILILIISYKISISSGIFTKRTQTWNCNPPSHSFKLFKLVIVCS